MKLTTDQINDFKDALTSELECHIWDFIKTYTAELTTEDVFVDEYDDIRNQLLTAQESLNITFD